MKNINSTLQFTGAGTFFEEGYIDNRKCNHSERKRYKRSRIQIPIQLFESTHNISFAIFRNFKAICKQSIADTTSPVNAAIFNGQGKPDRLDPRTATPNQKAARLIKNSDSIASNKGSILVMPGNIS